MKRILIIEDEQVIAEVQKDYLKVNGFSVEIEASGDMGLKKALSREMIM